MKRPPEYENLIRLDYFREVTPSAGFKEQYLAVAESHCADARKASSFASQYLLAYEGFYQMVQAVLEHYAVRATDRPGHRSVAIQRIAADLQMSPGEIKLISDAHARRNESTYRAPLPPISEKEAKAMMDIAERTLPKAKQLLQG